MAPATATGVQGTTFGSGVAVVRQGAAPQARRLAASGTGARAAGPADATRRRRAGARQAPSADRLRAIDEAKACGKVLAAPRASANKMAFDEVAAEVEERQAFLTEMRALGQADKWESQVSREIQLRMKELDRLQRVMEAEAAALT